jgi:hypothetical protein
MARPFRIEDRAFGNNLNVGGSAGLRFGSRLGAEVEFNETFGLEPRPAVCGVAVPPCVGGARQGLLSARIASANLLYYFGRSRTQFYVTGGAGALWSTEVTPMTVVRQTTATMSELRYDSAGFAWNVGAGVRMPLARGFLLRPEFRFYEASALSRANLSLIRLSMGLGYTW